jgi:hypothetical protein
MFSSSKTNSNNNQTASISDATSTKSDKTANTKNTSTSTSTQRSSSMAQRTSTQRTFSASSTASTSSVPTSPTSPTSVDMKRQSSSGSQRSDWERYSIGRHSNDVRALNMSQNDIILLTSVFCSGYLEVSKFRKKNQHPKNGFLLAFSESILNPLRLFRPQHRHKNMQQG